MTEKAIILDHIEVILGTSSTTARLLEVWHRMQVSRLRMAVNGFRHVRYSMGELIGRQRGPQYFVYIVWDLKHYIHIELH